MQSPSVFDVLNLSSTLFQKKKEEEGYYVHYSCNIVTTHWGCKKGIHPDSLYVFRVPSKDAEKHLQSRISAIPIVHHG